MLTIAQRDLIGKLIRDEVAVRGLEVVLEDTSDLTPREVEYAQYRLARARAAVSATFARLNEGAALVLNAELRDAIHAERAAVWKAEVARLAAKRPAITL
jgi:hypothetical protein